jgi:hypothetical protein
VIAIVAKWELHIRWLRTKCHMSNLDNFFNTGIYQYAILECLCMLIMPYPSLYEKVYYENANDRTVGIPFFWNDWFLCLMIFCRIHFLVRIIVGNTEYTDPRAQRVCDIYGADADYKFSLKALMKEKPWVVLAISGFISLIMLSY